MKRYLSLLLTCSMLLTLTACSSPLPKLLDLDPMTDAEIEELLVGRSRTQIELAWGKPTSTTAKIDTYYLDPNHDDHISWKILNIHYNDKNVVERVVMDVCAHIV